MDSFPRQRLGGAVEQAWRAFTRVKGFEWRVSPAIPILFFGDLDAYWKSELRVLTVGLNPSLHEFPADSPRSRFPLAKGLAPEQTERYLDALSAYFRTVPYRSWFNAFEPLLNGARASYYGGKLSTALHTDICSPVATDPTWSRLDDTARGLLEVEGGSLWHELLVPLRPHVVVLSVARRHLQRIQFRPLSGWKVLHRFARRIDGTLRRQPYEVRARWHEVGDAAALIVFGPAAQMPLGQLSVGDKRKAGEIVVTTWRGSR